MSMMLGDMAVTEVVRYLSENLDVRDESHTEAIPAYKYERPQKQTGEYIAVNHLPFVHRRVVEEGIVNVNVHVPVLKSNLPDIKRLATITEAIVELFPEGTYLGEKAYYEFLSDSRPTPDEDKTYYVNLQLQVTFNNLNS